MSYFRINLYLPIKYFLLSFVYSNTEIVKKIKKKLQFFTNKKEVVLTSQLRVGFILILKYLKKKNPAKNEVIVNSYNLAEMVNICKNLNLKIVYSELNKNLFLSKKDLKKKINNNTLAVVTTNIFNTYKDSVEVKKVCNQKKVTLIEDNAIYFGNFKKKKNKKIYAGSFGDYSLNSFNIMKNISAMYGGAVTTNNKDFSIFANEEFKNYSNFPVFKYFYQSIVFIILKILSINLLYKFLFLKILKSAYLNKNSFILGLVYPSSKFKKQKLPKYYSSKISNLSLKMIYLQLMDNTNFNKNHLSKKNNNIYYHKLLSQHKINGIELFKYEDASFQNYNDFPIVVEKKNNLVNFLFSKGIETKTIQYVDCQKFFKYGANKNLKHFEDKILCFPNHRHIPKKYIEHIVKYLKEFYKKKVK